MHRAADALLERPDDAPAGPAARNRVLPDGSDVAEARIRLILQLAADRLRELRDDGVTLAYVARMYGVATEEMERLQAELVPARPR